MNTEIVIHRNRGRNHRAGGDVAQELEAGQRDICGPVINIFTDLSRRVYVVPVFSVLTVLIDRALAARLSNVSMR